MGYTRATITGLSWMSLLRGFNRGGGLIRAAVLARLLTPEQFGIFGIAFLVLAFLELLTETGINVVLVQQESESVEAYVNTAWVVSIIRGVLISLLILISSPIIIYFFAEPRALPLLLVTSLIPIIRGFINPAIAKFQKNLAFNKDFAFRSSLVVVETVVSVLLAFITRSPMSLVIGLLAAAITEVILSLYWVKPRPKWVFDRTQFVAILQAGKWVTLAGILEYLASRGPDIAIGRLLSSTSLGLYQMAHRFTVIPISEIIEVSNRVTFPVYVKIAQDKKRLFKAFAKNYAGLVLLSLPLLAALYLLAKPITLLVLGDAWSSVIPLIRSFALVNILIVLCAPSNPLFLGAKRQDYLTTITLVRTVVVLCLIVPLTLNRGVHGAIDSILWSLILTLPLRWWYSYRILRSD